MQVEHDLHDALRVGEHDRDGVRRAQRERRRLDALEFSEEAVDLPARRGLVEAVEEEVDVRVGADVLVARQAGEDGAAGDDAVGPVRGREVAERVTGEDVEGALELGLGAHREVPVDGARRRRRQQARRRQRKRVDRVRDRAAARRGRGAVADDEFVRRRAVGTVDREAFLGRLDGVRGCGYDLGHFLHEFFARGGWKYVTALSVQFSRTAEYLRPRREAQL